MPLPTGLVVKNGSNARSITSWLMPQPVSVIEILRYSPGWMSPTALAAIVTLSDGDGQLPFAVHRVAGVDREVEDRIFQLVRIDEDRPGIAASSRVSTRIRSPSVRSSSSRHAARPVRRFRRAREASGSERAKDSKRRVSAAARVAPSIALVRWCMTSLRGPFRRRRARSIPPTTTASILLKSCAMPPVSWPTASIFWTWRSWASAAWRSIASVFERLVGFPQFLRPVAHGLLEQLRRVRLRSRPRAARPRSGAAPGPRRSRGRSPRRRRSARASSDNRSAGRPRR